MNRSRRNRCLLRVELLEDRNTPSAAMGDMPLEALGGLDNAAEHNDGSQAGHSGRFASEGTSHGGTDDDEEHGPPPAADDGLANAVLHNTGSQAGHSPNFASDGVVPKVLPALPDAASKGHENALIHNANSQAQNHSRRMGAAKPLHGKPDHPVHPAHAKGLVNAAIHNAGSQAADHSPKFRP